MSSEEPPKIEQIENKERVFVSPDFASDMRRAGWTLLKDRPIKEGERISFPIARKRGNFIELNWGQRQGEAALLAQKFIPEPPPWKKWSESFHVILPPPEVPIILLMGTLWKDDRELEVIPCLQYNRTEEKYYLSFHWPCYEDMDKFR